jgi:uncharacterized protein (DUF2147 family)
MRRSLLLLSVLCALLVLGACSSEPAKAPEPTAKEAPATPAATPDASADPLSGTWKGDWGPSASHRNPVTVELKWDGTALSGTVNPGPDAVPLTKGSFNKDTGAVTMEADAKGHDGKAVHYTIEGKVDGTTMSGSWNHDDKKGDFKLMKG